MTLQVVSNEEVSCYKYNHLFTLFHDYWKYIVLSAIAISNVDNVMVIIISVIMIIALILIALIEKKS